MSIHRAAERVGFIKSLNLGLEASKDSSSARMDGDDFSHLERFEKEVAYLETHPDVNIVKGQMNIMDENGRITSSSIISDWRVQAFFVFLREKSIGSVPTVMDASRRSLIEAIDMMSP